jgi:hypothetical protein
MFFCACTDKEKLQQAKTKTVLGLISLGPHADCFKLHPQQECNKCARDAVETSRKSHMKKEENPGPPQSFVLRLPSTQSQIQERKKEERKKERKKDCLFIEEV